MADKKQSKTNTKSTSQPTRPREQKVSIRQLENIVPAPPIILSAAERRLGGTLSGFLTFLRQQGVVGLAVGLVLGGAVSTLVKSLIDNIVTPPLGFVLGSAEGLKGLRFYLGQASGKSTYINYGVFLNDFVNFVIIAVVVYLVIHLLRLDKLDKPKS